MYHTKKNIRHKVNRSSETLKFIFVIFDTPEVLITFLESLVPVTDILKALQVCAVILKSLSFIFDTFKALHHLTEFIKSLIVVTDCFGTSIFFSIICKLLNLVRSTNSLLASGGAKHTSDQEADPLG